MSIVLVCLPSAPKVSEEAVRKDAELNKYLESRVEGETGWMEKNIMSVCANIIGMLDIQLWSIQIFCVGLIHYQYPPLILLFKKA